MSVKGTVLKAINQIGSEVTVADVVTQTGLSKNDVSRLLNVIASETGGNLAVTESGDIVYRFDKNLSMRYLRRGVFNSLRKFFGTFFGLFLLLFRISFGIVLLGSILFFYSFFFLFVSIFGVLTGASGAASNMRIDFIEMLKKLALNDLFVWKRKDKQDAPPQGFLLNCFDFLFGPGDPNTDLVERRWKLIAQVIRENEGVVTAEHLAPYFGPNPDEDMEFLSVLGRFDGQPVVSEQGNIIYVFPTLSAVRQELTNEVLPQFLHEKYWPFMRGDTRQFRSVCVLAAVNFIGAWALWMYWWFVPPGKQWQGTPLIAFIMASYGILFMLIPAFRYLFLGVTNRKIQSRNANNEALANMLTQRNSHLQTKLWEAEQIRLTERKVRQEQIVYTTEKDNLEQEHFPL